jgi:hypothetical protein
LYRPWHMCTFSSCGSTTRLLKILFLHGVKYLTFSLEAKQQICNEAEQV